MDRIKNLEIIAKLCDKEIYDETDEFAYDYAESLIKNYCNIKTVPDEMEKTLIDMSCEIIKGGNIRQIREGDITVSFMGENGEGTFGIKNYEKQLRNFRRPKW